MVKTIVFAIIIIMQFSFLRLFSALTNDIIPVYSLGCKNNTDPVLVTLTYFSRSQVTLKSNFLKIPNAISRKLLLLQQNDYAG